MLGWATDLHFDHASEDEIEKFLSSVKTDHLLITGDIANGKTVENALNLIQERLKIPVYFVLGNHDFYGSSIKEIREKAKKFNYLPQNDVAIDGVLLVGADGWADGRSGNFHTSPVLMNDFELIDEPKNLTVPERLNAIQKLSKESNDLLEEKIINGLKHYDKIIIATHVPPFRQACLYQSEPSDDAWAPYFVNTDLGYRLIKIFNEKPQKKGLVLSGHSHNTALYSPLLNLEVRVGNAEYGYPTLQSLNVLV
jgi:predicted MPP superfamily phosphohydrolase